MFVKRYWRGRYNEYLHERLWWRGVFLFGIIPIFITQIRQSRVGEDI